MKLKNALRLEFDMKDLGGVKKILGMEIKHDKNARKILVSQKGYIQKVLRKFGMFEAKPISVPLAMHFKLSMK